MSSSEPPGGRPSYPPQPDQSGGQQGYPPPPISPPPPGPVAPAWTPPAGPEGYYAQPGQPGYEAPQKKSSRRTWITLAVLGTIVVVIVGGFFLFRDRLAGEAAALQVGDCIDLPAADGTFTEVQHQPCNGAHDAEVVLVFTHPAPVGEPYPVVSGFQDFALERCLPAFESYVGRDYETDPDLELGFFHPTITGWADGDRGFTCHVMRVDNAKLTATVRAGGAPPSP